MLACNQKGFLYAWLAKLLDWLWAFVCGEITKQQKKSVSFPLECQMVPSLLQLVRRGRGHLDAGLRSCEILQSPLSCENSTYYATEKSICSGRHLPKSPPGPWHKHSSPSALLSPSIPPASHRSSQLNEQHVEWKQDLPFLPMGKGTNVQPRDAMDGGTHLHSCSMAAESTDVSPVRDFARLQGSALKHSCKERVDICCNSQRELHSVSNHNQRSNFKVCHTVPAKYRL